MSKRFVGAVGCLATAAMLFPPMDGFAQTSSRPLAFDVASIHRNVENVGTCTPGQTLPTPRGLHMTNCELFVAVGVAYVPTTGDPLGYLVEKDERIVGIPNSLAQERYNIDARIADSDAAAWRDPVQQKEMLRSMMQTLLAERCRLVVHREWKDKPIYALVVGNKGPKFESSVPDEVEIIRAKHPEATAVPGGSGFFFRGPGSIDMYGVTTDTLALLLSGPAGRTVVDKTGLTGKYNMHLNMEQQGLPAADGSADPAVSVFLAVQEQLGLKLQSQKDQVEILVIDHIERPSLN